MLNVDKSINRGQKIHAQIPQPQRKPCSYANTATTDYFNLLALNEAGEAMILEDLTAISAWGSWHLINGLLEKGENPVTAAQHMLLNITGYDSNNWLYLGSFMLNAGHPNITGHFFLAYDVQLVTPPDYADQPTCVIKWVPRRELKHALLDGRIGIMSYAVTTSLALLL